MATIAISSMQQKVDELKKRTREVMLGGGADKLEKQRKSGRLTARERIEPATLSQLDWLVGKYIH